MVHTIAKKVFLALFISLNIYFTFSVFPIESLYSDDILINNDYPFKYYSASISERFVSTGVLHGFDNQLLGSAPVDYFGYSNIYIKIASLFLDVDEPILFTYYIIMLYMLGPILVYFSAKNLKNHDIFAILAGLTAVFLQRTYLFAYGHIYGFIDFVFAVYLGLYVFTLFHKYSTGKPRLTILLILSIILVGVHPYGLILLCPTAVYYLLRVKNLSRNQIILLIGFAASALLIFMGYCIVHFADTQFRYTPIYQGNIYGVLDNLITYHSYLLILLAFSIIGIMDFKRDIKWYLISVLLFFFSFGFLLSNIYIFGQLRTYMLSRAFFLYLILPAANGIYLTYHRAVSKKSKNVVRGCSILALFVMVLFVRHGIQYAMEERLTVSLPHDVSKVIEWLQSNTDNSARVLIQDSHVFSSMQYGTTIMPYLVIKTNKMYAGSQFPYYLKLANDDLRPPVFIEEKLFNVPINEISTEEAEYLFRLYNIGWVVAYSKDAHNFLHNQSFLSFRFTQGSFRVFEVNHEQDYFLEGSGDIFFYDDIISVYNSTQGMIVIKSFYMDNMITEPEMDIQPYNFNNQLFPFIQVNCTYGNFTIRHRSIYDGLPSKK